MSCIRHHKRPKLCDGLHFCISFWKSSFHMLLIRLSVSRNFCAKMDSTYFGCHLTLSTSCRPSVPSWVSLGSYKNPTIKPKQEHDKISTRRGGLTDRHADVQTNSAHVSYIPRRSHEGAPKHPKPFRAGPKHLRDASSTTQNAPKDATCRSKDAR